MNVEAAIAERARVEEFQRSHRIELVTMLFTDLVDSTGLKGQIGDRAAIELLKRHDILVRSTLAEFSGAAEINGAGDSFFLVFAKPSDAARFALLLQHRMRALTEPGQPALRDRVGIHVGEVFVEDRRDAGPVDEVRRRGCVEHDRVGSRTGRKVTDVGAPQCSRAAGRRRGERLVDRHPHVRIALRATRPVRR